MSTLDYATRSDLTPRQGATLDNLPANWTIHGRADSDLATLMDMAPEPYPEPPMLVFVRDPTGGIWQIDREGNLNHRDHRKVAADECLSLLHVLDELARAA